MALKYDCLSPEGFRVDGRKKDEKRISSSRVKNVSRLDSFSFYKAGNTQINASVHGPKELSKHLHSEKAEIIINIEFNGKRKPSKTEEMEIEIKKIVETAIHTFLYPKTEIKINIAIIEDDGGVFAAAINAVCLALSYAGLSMSFLFSACSSLYDNASQSVLIDPNKQEESTRNPVFTFCAFEDGSLICSVLEPGGIYPETFAEMQNQTVTAIKDIFINLKKTIYNSLAVSL